MATLNVEDLSAPKSDDAKKEVEELHQSREMKKASRKLAVFLLSWLFLVVVGIGITTVSYTHLTLPTTPYV